MSWIHKAAGKLGHVLLNFAENEDRAGASLAGAPVEYTVSGEIGKHQGNPVTDISGEILDDIQADHVQNANDLDAALNAFRTQYKKDHPRMPVANSLKKEKD